MPLAIRIRVADSTVARRAHRIGLQLAQFGFTRSALHILLLSARQHARKVQPLKERCLRLTKARQIDFKGFRSSIGHYITNLEAVVRS